MTLGELPDHTRSDMARCDMTRCVSPSRLKGAAVVALIVVFWGALFALWVSYAV